MVASTSSRGAVLPSLGMSPKKPISSTHFFTSIYTRPTICVAALAPVVTTQSSGVSTTVETSISMEIHDSLSPEEYRLAVQKQKSQVDQSSHDLNHPYFSHYGVDGTPIYSFPFQSDEHGNPIYFPAPEAYQYINGFIPTLPVQPSNQQGQPL